MGDGDAEGGMREKSVQRIKGCGREREGTEEALHSDESAATLGYVHWLDHGPR